MGRILIIMTVIWVVLGTIIGEVFGIDYRTSGYIATAIVLLPIVGILFFYFGTRKGRTLARLYSIQEIRSKRILRECSKMTRAEHRKWEREYAREERRKERLRHKVGADSESVCGFPSDGCGFGF